MVKLTPPSIPEDRPGPRGGKRDQNRREKVARLCEVAVSCFVARGIDAVTIDEITKEAGVAKGSFYRYFDDKAQLIETLYVAVQQRVEGAFDVCEHNLGAAETEADLNEAYLTLAGSLAELFFEHGELIQIYLAEMRGPKTKSRAPIRALADTVTARGVSLSERAQSLGLLEKMDPRVTTRVVIGAVEKILWSLLDEESLGDPLEIPAIINTLVLDGLRAKTK